MMRGARPRVGLLVADPQRLEDRVRRVEVRAHGAVEVRGRDRVRRARPPGPRRGGPSRSSRGAPVCRPSSHTDHPVQLRAEREAPDRRAPLGRPTSTRARPLDRRVHRHRGPARPTPGMRERERRRSRTPTRRASPSARTARRSSLGCRRRTRSRTAAGHGTITIFKPVPERIVSNASAIWSSGHRWVTTAASTSCLRSR